MLSGLGCEPFYGKYGRPSSLASDENPSMWHGAEEWCHSVYYLRMQSKLGRWYVGFASVLNTGYVSG